MKVGDIIVYPMHGAGKIIEIQERKFDGETLMYCTVEMNIRDLQMQFPKERMKELNIRSLTTLEHIQESLDLSAEKEFSNKGNWNKRYQRDLDRLKTGEIESIADAIVNFHLIEKNKGLSSGERQLFHTATNLLVSEIMFIEDIGFEKGEELLQSMLKEALCKVESAE